MLNVSSISGRSKITPLYMASGAPLSSAKPQSECEALHAGWGYRKGSLASLMCTSGCEGELGPEKALFLWQRLLKLWDTRPGAGTTWAPEKQGIAAVSAGKDSHLGVTDKGQQSFVETPSPNIPALHVLWSANYNSRKAGKNTDYVTRAWVHSWLQSLTMTIPVSA